MLSKSEPKLRNASSENESLQPSKILNSWKEIASYTGRGVRTVQRYEVQFGFPIRRPAGTSRSAVMAFADEVEAWLRQAPVRSPLPARDNVIEMPSSGSRVLDGDTGACPFCHGTGKAADGHPLANGGASSTSNASHNGKFHDHDGNGRRQGLSN